MIEAAKKLMPKVTIISAVGITSLALGACGGGFQPAPEPVGPPPIPAVTGSATELQRVFESVHDTYWPRASQDGKYVLAHQRDDTKLGGERFSIVRVQVGSPGITPVSEGFADKPAWYPDNRRFVYTSTRTGSPRVVRSNAMGLGSGLTFVTSSISASSETNPDVSPDGKKIAFNTTIRNQVLLATVNSDGSEFTLYGEGVIPRWSPDGTKIAFQRAVGNWFQIFTMDLSSGGQVSQITAGEVNHYMPTWSPDGSRIAYISDRADGRHLWIMTAEGANQTQLTSGSAEEVHPDWGHDGRIYFSSNAGGRYNVWRLRPVLEGM
ncbi:MAG: hypothetical protein ACE5GJ_06780 [Gemmatimonadota bacterium]